MQLTHTHTRCARSISFWYLLVHTKWKVKRPSPSGTSSSTYIFSINCRKWVLTHSDYWLINWNMHMYKEYIWGTQWAHKFYFVKGIKKTCETYSAPEHGSHSQKHQNTINDKIQTPFTLVDFNCARAYKCLSMMTFNRTPIRHFVHIHYVLVQNTYTVRTLMPIYWISCTCILYSSKYSCDTDLI